MAMKPEERPMSFTSPIPRRALRASVLAAISAPCDLSTDVSKPKHLSICSPQAELKAQVQIAQRDLMQNRATLVHRRLEAEALVDLQHTCRAEGSHPSSFEGRDAKNTANLVHQCLKAEG